MGKGVARAQRGLLTVQLLRWVLAAQPGGLLRPAGPSLRLPRSLCPPAPATPTKVCHEVEEVGGQVLSGENGQLVMTEPTKVFSSQRTMFDGQVKLRKSGLKRGASVDFSKAWKES